MKLAEDIWRGSLAARTNMIAAANYSAAFYGNAALQGWRLGLTAPLTFWQAMARAMDGPVANDAAPVGNVAELQAVPVAEPMAEPMAEPVPQPVAAEAEEIVEAGAAAAPRPNPALLDAPRAGQGDDLKAVRGIGAKLADSLNEIGIYHYDQLAGLDGDAIDWLDENIPGFKRICARFDIVSGAASRL